MRRNLRDAALAMTAALLSMGSLVALHAPARAVVLAVVLAMTLSRTERPTGLGDRASRLVLLPVFTVVTSLIGMLWTPIGDAVFCLAVAATIWVRRFGPRWSAVGRLATAPLVALLILPVQDPLWAAVAAVAALLWVYATHLIVRRPPTPAAKSTVSTRMAVQMGVALAIAFVLGRTVFDSHWAWVVLTAFIVCSGNRGRGDVVYKSVLRVGGALGGTALATGLLLLFGQYKEIDVVAIFMVLAAATSLRPVNYAWWAGGVTAALAFLYASQGEGGTELLAIRLAAIIVGGLIGVAASWLILPVRTTTVVRGRIAKVLATLSDLLKATADGTTDLTPYRSKFDGALDNLDQIAPPLHAHRRISRRSTPHWADLIDMLRRCAPPVHAITDRMSVAPTEAAAEVLVGVSELRRSIAQGRVATPMLDRRLDGLAEALPPA